jgi:hypothetical protein
LVFMAMYIVSVTGGSLEEGERVGESGRGEDILRATSRPQFWMTHGVAAVLMVSMFLQTQGKSVTWQLVVPMPWMMH